LNPIFAFVLLSSCLYFGLLAWLPEANFPCDAPYNWDVLIVTYSPYFNHGMCQLSLTIHNFIHSMYKVVTTCLQIELFYGLQ
jgi:hypothetical protein